MNKENAVRRRIANTYNRPEEDFPSLRAYNDYLEEVEDIIFNLIEGINLQATEAKIKAYQEENADQIVAARARKAERIAAALRQEKLGTAAADGVPLTIEQDDDMEDVIFRNTIFWLSYTQKYHDAFGASGIEIGAAAGSQYAPSLVGGPIFMQPRPMGPGGQPGSNEIIDDPVAQKHREERGARAGGWTLELAQKRIWEEALGSLWVS